MAGMEEITKVREQILDEAERLGPDDTFSFSCHPGVACFNECCGDVNIVLTPYDVLRLKRRLSLSSTELLQRYTIKPFTKDQKLPVVLLKMDDNRPGKPCHLVTEKGCSVYEDRPWPCRMYPIGSASARTEQDPNGPEFFFVMQEQGCKGFGESHQWTIRQWMEDQGVADYDRWGDAFKEITLHPALRRMELNPQQMEMFYTACYDLDRFRGFVFESSFLDKYEIEPEVVQAMRDGDEALLQFGFRWLRACLFGEPTVQLRAGVADQYRKRLERQGMRPQQAIPRET